MTEKERRDERAESALATQRDIQNLVGDLNLLNEQIRGLASNIRDIEAQHTALETRVETAYARFTNDMNARLRVLTEYIVEITERLNAMPERFSQNRGAHRK